MSSTAPSGMGDESQQGPLIALQISLLLVAVIMSSLRIWSRLLIVRSLGLDDYILNLTTLLSLALTINDCLGANFGWGKHLKDITAENYSNILKIGWVAQILYTLTTSMMKISILTFYLRLANTKTYRRIIYATILWISLWCLAFVFVIIFQCDPVSSYWTPPDESPNAKCFNASPPLLINGVTNIIHDLFVYVLPMPMLWRVQLPKKQRIGLIVLFGFGSLVNIAGGLRLYYSIVVNESGDGTWLGFQLWTWEAVEVNLGIACTCVPALKPLLLRWFPNAMHSVFGATAPSSHSKKGLSAGGNGTFQMKNPKGGRSMGSTLTGSEEGVTMTHVYAGKSERHVDGESMESLTDHSTMVALGSRR